MKRYTWEELTEIQDFEHGQEFVTVDEFTGRVQDFFDKIKHGDDSHKEWLAVEFEKFYDIKITR